MPSAAGIRYLEALPAPRTRARGALVLLHAFPLNARMWESQLAFAGSGWHVIAPHVRGVDGGREDRPCTPVTMDDYAGDVIDLLDALHVEDAVFCGLSMGGYLALAVLRHASRYVRALILADTKAEADTDEALKGRRALLTTIQTKGMDAVADAMIPKLLGETTRAASPQVVHRVRTLILANSSEATAGAVYALMSRADSTPLLASIRIPTLIIVGDEDSVTPPADAERMRANIAGAELVRIPGAGHLSNLERADEFNRALSRFLEHRI